MIAFAFLALILSLNITHGARLVRRTALIENEFLRPVNNNDLEDESFRFNADQYDTEYSNIETAFDVAYKPKIQSLRDMLNDMFHLIRSPDLDYITITMRFLELYQPRYKAEVKKFFKMMGRYSTPQFNHPILQRQRKILPLLMHIVSQVDKS